MTVSAGPTRSIKSLHQLAIVPITVRSARALPSTAIGMQSTIGDDGLYYAHGRYITRHAQRCQPRLRDRQLYMLIITSRRTRCFRWSILGALSAAE